MTSRESNDRAHTVAGAVARASYGKLVALLAARTGDIALAEDALSDAFIAALVDWPRSGCPTNPEAWLLTVARRKVIDLARRKARETPFEDLQLDPDWFESPAEDSAIPDHRLALMFACSHPSIDPGIRAPLILQVVLGLNAETIASTFLISPATMSQRLVRAKNKIKHAVIPFRVPEREELANRLNAVLDAIYAAFAEGWSDPGRTDVARRDLADEALFLGRLVAELLPREPEALGLFALMLHAEARRRARRNLEGEYVPFGEQDITLWDPQMIESAEALLIRASRMDSIGRYQLEGALQSAHVHRRRTGHLNWPAVVQLYDALLAFSGSPVVAINRALALAETDGAEAALQAIDGISADRRLMDYQPYWASRAELFAKTGAHERARQAYDIAIGLERDPAVRRFLERRRSATLDYIARFRDGEPPGEPSRKQARTEPRPPRITKGD
jgi:predicted RNA polymerase sigma factor